MFFFMDGSRSDHIRHPDSIRQQQYDKLPQIHDDGAPVSVCYRYVTWLDGMCFRDADRVHAMYANIEVWTAPWGSLYLYHNTEGADHGPLKTACQKITLDLLDPDLAAKIQYWRMECLVDNVGLIPEVVAEGPLSYQEPPGFDWEPDDQFGPRIKFENLSSILRLGTVVELPSVDSQALALAYESATGYAITLGNESYVPNLPTVPTISTEEVRIDTVRARTPDQWLWPVLRLVDAGVLTVRRMVFKYGNALQDTTRMLMDSRLSASNIAVFIVVKEIDDSLWWEIESTGVRNFIAPERFRLNPPVGAAYRALVSQAHEIIYRPFYNDLAQ